VDKKWNLILRTVCTVAALTLTAAAVPAQNNGNGNAFGANKDYPYGTNQSSSRPYLIGLWGDLPYSQSQADAIPAMIEDMNSQDLVFTVHDGDLRQGSGVPSCALNSSNGEATLTLSPNGILTPTLTNHIYLVLGYHFAYSP